MQINWLVYLNSIFINLSIIVASMLIMYFLTLQKLINGKSLLMKYRIKDLNIPYQLFIGFVIGCLALILSYNRVPIDAYSRVDTRYILIYFAFFYESVYISWSTALTLIALKTISFIAPQIHVTPVEYWNNIIFTLLIVVIGTLVKKYCHSVKQSHATFLTLFLVAKFISYTLYFPDFPEQSHLVAFAIYTVTFIAIFVSSTYLIHIAIQTSESVLVYKKASIYDPLTGLLNRESLRFFLNTVLDQGEKEKEPQSISLAILDVDNFKEINDSLGHEAGDQALLYLSRIFKQNTVTNIDYIGRLGGDEFGLVLSRTSEESEELLELIKSHLEKVPFVYQGETMILSLSIGMVHTHTSKFFNRKKILLRADELLYEAKRQGKNIMISQYLYPPKK